MVELGEVIPFPPSPLKCANGSATQMELEPEFPTLMVSESARSVSHVTRGLLTFSQVAKNLLHKSMVEIGGLECPTPMALYPRCG